MKRHISVKLLFVRYKTQLDREGSNSVLCLKIKQYSTPMIKPLIAGRIKPTPLEAMESYEHTNWLNLLSNDFE